LGGGILRAKLVNASFEGGNLVVTVPQHALEDAKLRKQAARELSRILRLYFGVKFQLYFAVLCAFFTLVLVLTVAVLLRWWL